MKEPVFKGSCTAIITPFTSDGIDYGRLKKQLDFQSGNGIKAIVIAGTTGEISTLKSHEYEKLVAFSIRYTAGRMKCIVGIGGNCTEECMNNAEFAQAAGADAVLMTTPYYNKTTQSGLIEHFYYVADRVETPVILYNIPGRTGIGISAETYAILAKHPKINGVKEASGDFSLISRILADCAGFNVWSGNDDQTVPMMALGAKGVVSVASNLIPHEISEICDLCLAGQFYAATQHFSKISEFCRMLFSETNPIPIKCAMSLIGTDSGLLRLPLVAMSETNLVGLRREMEKLGLPCSIE